MSIFSAISETIAAAITAVIAFFPHHAHAGYSPACSSTITTNCLVGADGVGALPSSVVSGVTMQGSQISGAIPTATLPASNLTGNLPNSLGGLQSLYHQTAISTGGVSTTTPMSIISNGYCNGTTCSAITIKANTCRAGMAVRVTGGGIYTTAGTVGPAFTGAVNLGTTQLATGTTGTLLTGGPFGFDYNFIATFLSCGSTGSVLMQGKLEFIGSGNLSAPLYLVSTSPVTIDTTVNQNLDIVGAYSASNPGNNFKNYIVDAILEP